MTTPDTGTETGARALREYLATEVAGAALLVIAAVAALVWANSPWRASYASFWHTDFAVRLGQRSLSLDLHHWVNDGLMAVFFLVVGLEVKRELLLGELRDRKAAALPVFGALGGMALPALIYLGVHVLGNGTGGHGWGIPVATDIAFALGVLAIVAPGIPSGVRLFLLTLAIVDDIGAILLIAIFYSHAPDLRWLTVAALICVSVVVLQRLGYRAPWLFGALGVLLWLAVHASGVHATVAGVAMGLLAPSSPVLDREIIRSRRDDLLDVFSPKTAQETSRLARQAVSELEWLEHRLHGFASVVVVPLFALANAGIALSVSAVRDAASSPVAFGVVAGLVLGKTLGIVGGAWIGTRLGMAVLPVEVRWRDLAGVAALGGIGFTVSIFISNLAFADEALVNDAKLGIIAASVLASIVGALILRGHRRSAEPNFLR